MNTLSQKLNFLETEKKEMVADSIKKETLYKEELITSEREKSDLRA